MSAILGSAVTGAGGSSAYTIDNSVRLRSSASAGLQKTFSNSRTSGTIMTFSTWLKRGSLASATYAIFRGYDGSSAAGMGLNFGQDGNTDQLTFQFGGADGTLLKTTQVFRDPSSWYHIVLAIDTTQATNTNRVKMYVNGSQITSFAGTFYPSQNATHQFLLTNSNNAIGYRANGSDSYFDGYMAETYCIDGQALTPSSFGETNASTGVWQPKAYTGSYGTNGFYLKFSDIATTSGSNAGLGKDFSGNANYWNTNNISVTAGVTYDAMTDSPTPKSSTVGNYCVLNPLRINDGTVTNGNLTASQSANAYVGFGGSIAMRTGKWYWEVTCTSIGFVTSIGITNSNSTGGITSGIWTYHYDGTKYIGASNQAYSGNSYTSGDVLGFAFDADAGSLTCYKNNVSQGVLVSGLSVDDYYAYATLYGSWNIGFNFGQRPFVYTPPSSYNRLQTYNLPTPTIGASSTTLANKYFDATLYTGTGSAQSIVNSGGFQPALVWGKSRSNAYPNVLSNLVVGATKYLVSNNTDAETTDAGYISAINSNGFSVGTSGGLNVNGGTFVGWQWAGNGTGVTNTAGSITSTVSANTTSGFSVVTYTGTGGSGSSGEKATFGHGLGVAPNMVIIKNRSGTSNWLVYHSSVITAASGNKSYLALNLANAISSNSVNSTFTTVNSSIIGIGGDTYLNASGNNYVAYCFAEKTGFSKFGSYTGNGSTDGAFVYTGFRPKYLMVKCSSNGTTNWVIVDTSRSPYNVTNLSLEANAADGEQTGTSSTMPTMDLLSNGFKIRTTSIGGNGNGYTYIYAAFAESPFNYSLAR